MNEPIDAIVVGAGIVGTSTACHLLKRGKKVLLLDRREPGEETSYGNVGVMEISYVLPLGYPPERKFLSIALGVDCMARLRYRDLLQTLPWLVDFYRKSTLDTRRKNGKLLYALIAPSINEHKELMRGTDAERFWRSTGRIGIYRTETTYAESANVRMVAKEISVPFTVLSTEEVLALEPHLKLAFYKGILWPTSGRLTNPGGVVKAYAEKFVRDGGRFVKAEAQKLTPLPDGIWEVEGDGAKIRARNIVICAGPWATEILKPLGCHFPLGFKRGYHQHFSAHGSASLSHSISDMENGYALASMEQGFRITSGAEFASLDAPPNPIQIQQILPRARELFPLGEPLEPKAWMGARPCFTDSLPVIGESSRHKGLWFNFGHGHVGMTIGPSSGRLVAEMISGHTPFCDPHPYRPDRFN